MLKQINIHNIILIEEAEIHFDEGFNVLSGETGSGKSAIMSSLALVVGTRADTSLLRRGADRGYVEAAFDIANSPMLHSVLDNAGITIAEEEYLIIRRELSSSGKSRAFINNQMANLALLRNVGNHLVEIVGQHANQQLFSTENHRQILDTFGSISGDAVAFQSSWNEEQRCRHQLDDLTANEASRLRTMEMYRNELDEISSANLQEGEEDELFNEYTLLTNAEELAQKTQTLCDTLIDGEQPLLPALTQSKILLSSLAEIDPALDESAKSYQDALVNLEEVARTLRNYLGNINHDPIRADQVNNRLSLINKLKKKYGATISDVLQYEQETLQKLELLESAEYNIDELRERLQQLEKKNNAAALVLTEKRYEAARKLEVALTQELQSLNMPKASLTVQISTQQRTKSGDDAVEFYMQPNVGEKMVSVRDCASGGELSRLLLAVQTLLTGKAGKSTLVFDEVDANIGGETAAVVGKKLKTIGKGHQVLCITHFPQVAKQADHHIQIAKIERDGRTITQVTPLASEERDHELARMAGFATV